MPDRPWWKLPKTEMGGELQRIIRALKSEQEGRRARYVRNLELYEGRKMSGYSAMTYSDYSEAEATADNFLDDRLNLVRSSVSTAVAEIYGKQKPKPQFQTLGATWSVRRKAFKLDRIVEGIFNQRQGPFQTLWTFLEDAGSEAALQGVAVIKVMADRKKKRIVHKLIPGPDVYFDPVEGRLPRCGYHREPIDEWTAKKLWPNAKGAINGAKEYEWYGAPTHSTPRSSRIIELDYAYRLPDGPDDPGTWAVLVDNTVVETGDWTAPDFPLVFFYWERHRDGIWGTGIADEGRRLAEEASELEYRLLAREVVASRQLVFYQEGSITPRDAGRNDETVFVPVEEGKQFPVVSTVPAFNQMDLQYLEFKKRAFWDAVGISEVSAAARREAGIDSAIGQITLNETKAGRQIIKAKRYEQTVVDLSHQHVWRLRELKEEDPELAIHWSGHALVRSIKFCDADPEDDAELTVSIAAQSGLPHDPAGRQQFVDVLYQKGLMSQEDAKQMIAWPDPISQSDIELAEGEYIDALIDRYLDAEEETWESGQYQAPEGFLINKMQALRKFTAAWFRARTAQMMLEAEEEKQKAEYAISLIARYIKELAQLMKPPPQPAAGPGGPPGAQPGPDMPAAQQNAPPGALPPVAPPPMPGPN